MITQKKDASSDTYNGKLSWFDEMDNMYEYRELTDWLIANLVEPHACGERICKLPLRPSLFVHTPPFLIFNSYDKEQNSFMPTEISRHLLWKQSTRQSPKMIKLTIMRSGFTITKNHFSNWLGTWTSPRIISANKTLKSFQKINHFPGSYQLSNKDLLWRHHNKMIKKFGKQDFDYMPMTYILPEDSVKFRKIIEKNGGIWILKPPTSCAGNGIRVISRWIQIPKNKSLVIQKYLEKPKLINGTKFDLRLYVLITGVDPLRIYLYSEGLVRFATSKYIKDVSYLFDRYMHLTNTSINKSSPMFRPNDSPNKCHGSMWALNSLWAYLSRRYKANIPMMWSKIKDLVIKTILSAEDPVFQSVQVVPTSCSAFQLYGFDVIIDENFKPWLLEVNNNPSMNPDTPLCSIIKGHLAKDVLNLVGFQIPNTLNSDDVDTLKMKYGEDILCFDQRLCAGVELSKTERDKQMKFTQVPKRVDYLETILENLTSDDVRLLIRYEDEISETGKFERIFPNDKTYKYLKYFDKSRYYNLLLDAWETRYGSNRNEGITMLRNLCSKKYHLSNTP